MNRNYFIVFMATFCLLAGVASAAKVRGAITAVDDAKLPGVEVSLVNDASGEMVATVLSNDQGEYEIDNLPPGRFLLRAVLPSFQPYVREGVDLTRGAVIVIDIQLEIGQLSQEVEVTAQGTPENRGAASSGRLAGELADLAPVRGDDFSSLLPLLPGVIRASDGRIVMKGGGATQSSLVVNNSTNVTDPATGDQGFTLPSSAIDEVEVLHNSYAAEYGRFSSGITNILTRRGTPEWKFSLNNFMPRPKFRDGALMGIGGFTPRFGVRGPLIKDRLLVAHTFQYRMIKTRVPGQPDLRNDKHLESFDSFSQFDLDINSRHSLTALASVYPRKLSFINMDTFNPREVTANLHQRGYSFGMSERMTISPSAILESTLSFSRFDVDVFGQGQEEMRLAPDGNDGNFFNLQRRNTRSMQVVENLTFLREGGGEHLFKIGVDFLRTTYDGLSDSRPVNILRADGTLSRKIEFSGATSQRVRSTDLAVYGQDRWKINDRLMLELGLRLDRDGVLGRTNVSPRFGMVLGILPENRGILRGGIGYFVARTPLTVSAFTSFEPRTETQFSLDGITQTGKKHLPHVQAPDLDSPYSLTWNVEYDQKIGEKWVFKTNYLRRNGGNEFLIDSLVRPDPALLLSTRGRSRYWELELTNRYIMNVDSFLLFSYVRSRAERDLNSYDRFYGNIRQVVVHPNEFSLADTDTPNRLVVQGTFVTKGDWIISPVYELRSGFPYTLLDENQDVVGPRNRAGRFPWLSAVDLDIQRWIKLLKWNVRIGVRIFNLTNSFNPRNIQSNIDSTQFGVFSNQIERKFGATLQIEN